MSLEPVAIAHTPYKQKFGIPRQSGLLDVPGEIELLPPFNQLPSVAGLESVSHLWLSFIFHQNPVSSALSVRPPRLGGNDRIGVFASRSSFRPNGLGLSLVKLERIEDHPLRLVVSGIDLLDQTPVIDIKPYLPYVDRVEGAVHGLAREKPARVLSVRFENAALASLDKAIGYSAFGKDQLLTWIDGMIGFDPRPAYKDNADQKVYRLQFDIFDIHWVVHGEEAVVQDLIHIPGDTLAEEKR